MNIDGHFRDVHNPIGAGFIVIIKIAFAGIFQGIEAEHYFMFIEIPGDIIFLVNNKNLITVRVNILRHKYIYVIAVFPGRAFDVAVVMR